MSGCLALAIVSGACATHHAEPPARPEVDDALSGLSSPLAESSPTTPPTTLDPGFPTEVPLRRRQSSLSSAELPELSGLIASRRQPGLFWAINDGGSAPALHAVLADGTHQGSWPIVARNQDWEALAWLPGSDQSSDLPVSKQTDTGMDTPSILIGDLGDNQERRDEYRILRLAEPAADQPPGSSLPLIGTLHFRYPDGPHNAEAMLVLGRHLLIFTKEKPRGNTPQPSQVYALALDWAAAPAVVDAQKVGELPTGSPTLETRLALRFAGVDLLQPTDADVDPDTHTLYILSYRDIRVMTLDITPYVWTEAPASRLPQLHDLRLRVLGTHNLPQAEAVAYAPGGWLLLGSEGRDGPLLQWPLPAPDT